MAVILQNHCLSFFFGVLEKGDLAATFTSLKGLLEGQVLCDVDS